MCMRGAAPRPPTCFRCFYFPIPSNICHSPSCTHRRPLFDFGSDYGGWPEDVGEYPVDHVTDEHREVMAEMCSRIKKPNMPSLPSVPPPPEVAGVAGLHVTAGAGLGMNITPLPGQDASLDAAMNDIAVAPFVPKKKKSAKKKGTVTPLPPSGAAGKKPAASKPPAPEDGETKPAAKSVAKPAAKPASPAKKEAPKPVSKKTLEMVSYGRDGEGVGSLLDQDLHECNLTSRSISRSTVQEVAGRGRQAGWWKDHSRQIRRQEGYFRRASRFVQADERQWPLPGRFQTGFGHLRCICTLTGQLSALPVSLSRGSYLAPS